jgi:hypothetical protein
VARDDSHGRARRRDRSHGLDAVLASLAPAASGPLAAVVERLLGELLAGSQVDGAGRGAAARSIVAALVAAGAEGAELWAREPPLSGGWRRLAGAGYAVTDAERHVAGKHPGYPGTVAVVHDGALAITFSGSLPGSDERERREELAETLLALVHVLRDVAPDTQSGFDEPGGPLRAA